MIVATAFWRRLDTPGHDACRLVQTGVGWRLEGAAVFLHDGAPAQLAYQVTCDQSWVTLHGEVRGWAGERPVELRAARSAEGVWALNDAVAGNLERCLDLDFGFTPATNLLQLRRAGLAVGQSADVPVAWLDLSTGALELLPQRYERRSESAYWYEAERFSYAALLEIAPSGFVERYPSLWEAQP
jgi:hypothetical protein